MGFHSQTPLSILAYLTKMWVKVQNHEKVASTDAFKFLWGYHPAMHIKTYAVKINKRHRAMKTLTVPCDDALKVITYVDNIHKSASLQNASSFAGRILTISKGGQKPNIF